MMHSTLIGGSQNENADGIYVDGSGNVFVSSETDSDDLPMSGDSYQSSFDGTADAFLFLLSADFSTILYGTYMGGSAYDTGRSCYMDAQGSSLYLTCSTYGSGWPTNNAYDPTFNGGGWIWGSGDCIISKFMTGRGGGP